MDKGSSRIVWFLISFSDEDAKQNIKDYLDSVKNEQYYSFGSDEEVSENFGEMVSSFVHNLSEEE